MRKVLTLLILFSIVSIANAGIVYNTNSSGASTEDSLAVIFANLDSTGTAVALGAGDSVYVMVWEPNGAEAFRDSMAGNDASITAGTWEDFAGGQTYSYKEAVSTLDGTGTPLIGVYKVAVTVDDISENLTATYMSEFQLIESAPLSTLYDELQDILDTLQNHDNWVALEASVQILRDSLELYDTRFDSLLASSADVSMSDKIWVDGSPTIRGYIDVSIASRGTSDLTEASHIGVDWGDLINVTTSNDMTGTYVGVAYALGGSALDAIWEYDQSLITTAGSIGETLRDSLLAVQDTLEATHVDVDANQTDANTIISNVSTVDGKVDAVDNYVDTEISDLIDSTNAVLTALRDSLYLSMTYQFGVWVDENSGNSDADMGIDGTQQNPVNNLIDARVIADSLGVKKYYIMGRTVLTGASEDLGATHEEWEFVGIGEGNEIGLGNQDLDGSHFYNLGVEGTQAGTGRIEFDHCEIDSLNSVLANFHGCGLKDEIEMRASADVYMKDCYSMVAGGGTPVIVFGVASGDLSMRNYSGGIRIDNADANESISIEGRGQVVVHTDCSSATINVRGLFRLTDNGTSTTFVDDANFDSRYLVDDVWNEDSTGHAVANYMGWLTSQTGASGGVSDADMADIADSVWNIAFATAFQAGSMGDSMNNAYPTLAEIVDAFWNEDTTGHAVANYMGWLVSQTGAGQSITDGDMADIADSVWNLLTTTVFEAGSMGDSLANMFAYLDGVAVYTGIEVEIEANQTDANTIIANVATVEGKVDVIDDYVDSEIATIDTEVGENQIDLDAIIASLVTIDTEIGVIDGEVGTIDTEVGVIDGIVDSIATAVSDSSMVDKIWRDLTLSEKTVYSVDQQVEANVASVTSEAIQEADFTGTPSVDIARWNDNVMGDYATEFNTAMAGVDTMNTGAGSDSSKYLTYMQSLIKDVEEDSSGGGGASITASDMADIADSVWMADFEAHDGVAGSFGDSSQTWGATSASSLTVGTLVDSLEALGVTIGDRDNYACTTMVYDTGNSVGVAGVTVEYRNLLGALVNTGQTDENGYLITFNPTGWFPRNIRLGAGYTQTTTPDTMAVATSGLTDTLNVTVFSAGTPSGNGVGNLFGTIADGAGGVSGVIVTAKLPSSLGVVVNPDSNVVTPFSRSDTTDSDGYWVLPLYQYDVLSFDSTAVEDTIAYFIIEATEPSSNGIRGGQMWSKKYYYPSGETSVKFLPNGTNVIAVDE